MFGYLRLSFFWSILSFMAVLYAANLTLFKSAVTKETNIRIAIFMAVLYAANLTLFKSAVGKKTTPYLKYQCSYGHPHKINPISRSRQLTSTFIQHLVC